MSGHSESCKESAHLQREGGGSQVEDKETFVAFAKFIPRGEHEMGLKPNDVVEVYNRENPKWWYGRKDDGLEVSD